MIRTKLQFLFLLICMVAIVPFAAKAQNKQVQDIEKYIEKARMDWKVPGLAVGIIKDGQVVMSKGFGSQVAGQNRPVDGKTLFAIASNTKAFISAAIGILVEEGKLNWDDPVKKHLPYFQLYDDYVSEHTTVRDLLCHRVGLGTFSGDVIWYKSKYSAEETIKRAASVKKAYDFRAGYGYTNLMFITAGEVIKAVSGQSWATFINDRIFGPLNMNRTQTSTNELMMVQNVATPHKPVNGTNVPISWTNWDNMGAAGGIISCTDDMLKWMQLQLDGGRDIFSKDIQNEFWTLHNSRKVSEWAKQNYEGRHFSGYGLGWGLADYAGRMIVSHGGGYDGMYSRVVMVPDENLGIVVLTNSMKGISSALTNYIVDRYLERPMKDWSKELIKYEMDAKEERKVMLEERALMRDAKNKSSLALSDYAGTYRCNMYGVIKVVKKDKQLELEFPDAPLLNATLSHWEGEKFKINWKDTHAWFDFGTVEFSIDDNMQVDRILFDVPNEDIFFHEINAYKID